MNINYQVILNDPTHVVVVRYSDGDWKTGANFRDEAFDLHYVVPGAALTFAAMGLDFNYTAALSYLQKQVQFKLDNNMIQVVPPDWATNHPGMAYQGTIELTPADYIPSAS